MRRKKPCFCMYCGAPLVPDALFCTHCGNRLSNKADEVDALAGDPFRD